MSKNNRVLDQLVKLINALDDNNIIELPDLLERLRFTETSIGVVEFRKNINYKQVAKYLDKVECVFLAINRKRAWYACEQLMKITNRKIEYVKVIFNNKQGYLFSFSEPEPSN
jgi:hypothetical protein